MNLLPWIILFLPLAAAAGITFFTRQNRAVSAGLSIAAVVAGFGLSLIFIGATGWAARPDLACNWLSVGPLQVDLGLRLDPLSLLMMLMVTGVAGAIHVYSWGYMADDPGFPRFFACLSLFTFSMLGIVLANNFLMQFMFWELVGVSSYLLIGFWYERPAAADAGKKAFLTNRIGDFGFLLGILTVWLTLKSVNFATLETAIKLDPAALGGLATTAGLLIFCGAAGKSAQFPLHVWLPDAMEGPTPVSALIHAATMVAAGVYMLCRVYFLLSPPALHVIAWIGGLTALLAALIAVQQDDIKRILAYSTLSQLGYMVMAVGLAGAAGPHVAMFHLTTHAFFKALLFLGAGSVILGLHHEQDIWKMGGLRDKMPVTFWTFIVGTLSLAGVPPFSGFYSKDGILGLAWDMGNMPLFSLAAFVAALTSFYMFRLVFVVFTGPARGAAAGHAHESPGVMLWPLRVLACLSVVGGVIGIEDVYAHQFRGGEGMRPLLEQLVAPLKESPAAAGIGLAVAALGIAAAWAVYGRAATDPLPARLGAISQAMRDRFYWDEIYTRFLIKPHDWIAAAADVLDRYLIGGAGVRGTTAVTDLAGRALRLVQTGNLQTYAFLLSAGLVLVLYLALR